MEFVGIGDLHLSSQNGHGGFSRFLDDSDAYILSEVQRVLNLAKDRGIEQVILYGDICDSVRMSYRAHLQLVEFLRSNRDMYFHIILGNHDKFAKEAQLGHSCEVLEAFRFKHVRIYSEPTLVKFIDGSKVNFLPFPYSNFKSCLNVCHLDLAGAVADNGQKVRSKISSGKHPVVSGHIHSSSSFKQTYYSGTLYQLNFGESVDRKGFHSIECNGNDVEVEYVPFKPKYQLKTIVVENPKILQGLPSQNVFYRLLIPEDAEELNPASYAHLSVVQLKHWGSKNELSELQNFKVDFEELNLNVDEILQHILSKQYPSDIESVLKTREQILSRT